MNYCVLLKVSKSNLSAWHQLDSGMYVPLLKSDNNIIPLYFYANNKDFIFGKSARDRFFANDPYAFGNYFELIEEPTRFFNFFNNKMSIKQLLYIGIEQLLSDFIRKELFSSESLNELRSNFPLRFIYEADIEEKEKILIESLFLDAGYNNLERYEFNTLLLEILVQNKVINTDLVLILEGIGNNLYLILFDLTKAKAVAYRKLEGNGADPRLKILAELVVEYITAQNPFLTFEKNKEIGYILPHISNLLDNQAAIISGEIEFSSGLKYWFRINYRNIEDRLLYDSSDMLIYSAIDELLKSYGFRADKLTILLASEEVNTSYFIGKLLKKYAAVKGVEASHLTETMKLIFAKIKANNYSVKSIIPSLPSPTKREIAPRTDKHSPTIPSIPPEKIIRKDGSNNFLKPQLPIINELSKLVGKTGFATSFLNPRGKVEIDNTEFDAVCEVRTIEIGSKIKVVAIINRTLLKVDKIIAAPLLPTKKNNFNLN